MFNAIKLTEESLPTIIADMGDDQAHIIWITELFKMLPLYARMGRSYYVLKNYKKDETLLFTYPYCVITGEEMLLRADHIQLSDNF